jgi:hypothetical protein
MESGGQVGAAGASGFKLILLLFLSFVLTAVPASAVPQQSTSPTDDRVARVKALYDSGQWEAVVQAVPDTADIPAQLDLYRGLALAQLQRWTEAQKTFEAVLARNPRDARFLEELAGVEYEEKHFARAKRDLHRALTIDPGDAYASNFLASVYFLEGNLEAALKYWNRTGKPLLEDVSFGKAMELKPVLLDRAFHFSRGSEWQRDQFLTTQARLQALNVCSTTRFDLEQQSENSFQLAFDCNEREMWGAAKWQWVVSTFRGLPYQEIDPEFYNIHHAALNWLSLWRWDDQKRMIHSELTASVRDDPKWQYRVYVDGRNENWNLTGTFLPGSSAATALNLERAVAGAELRSIVSGRWSWSAGVEYSYRTMRNAVGFTPASTAFLSGGSGIAYRAGVQRSLVRIPERRFTVDASATGEFGTFFDRPLGGYARAGGDLLATWFPRARGDDYGMEARLRAGGTRGEVPFDELFMLGFDRDNDLWMRGHPGLRQGQKGAAPLGRNYALANWDVTKNVYSIPFVSFGVGPFVDTGKISDPSGFFGTPEWLVDTGVQAKIRVFGNFEFVLGWGKDLQSGRNSFFSGVWP